MMNLDFEDSDDAQMRVCMTHRRVNVCRKREGCTWSEDPDDVKAVIAYQRGEIDNIIQYSPDDVIEREAERRKEARRKEAARKWARERREYEDREWGKFAKMNDRADSPEFRDFVTDCANFYDDLYR